MKATQSNFSEQVKRRPTILEGISQGLRQTEIAVQLGVNRIIIKQDIRAMERQKDAGLKLAQKAAYEQLLVKRSLVSSKSSDKFLLMTGMTFQEKTFCNMVDFYRPELLRVLKSDDQCIEIMQLPKSVIRILKNNEIIIYARKNLEIAPRALAYLD
jgi:hypothetical protein